MICSILFLLVPIGEQYCDCRTVIFLKNVLQKHRGVADPLEVVAGEISDESILLCLDEFMVCHGYSSIFV